MMLCIKWLCVTVVLCSTLCPSEKKIILRDRKRIYLSCSLKNKATGWFWWKFGKVEYVCIFHEWRCGIPSYLFFSGSCSMQNWNHLSTSSSVYLKVRCVVTSVARLRDSSILNHCCSAQRNCLYVKQLFWKQYEENRELAYIKLQYKMLFYD